MNEQRVIVSVGRYIYMNKRSLNIRKLTQDDYFLIIELAPIEQDIYDLLVSIAKHIKSNYDEMTYIYGAFIDDVIIGFIYGFVLPNRTLLPQYLYVDTEYRGYKIGKKLLERLEKESKCCSSLAFFEKGLSEYYADQGYSIGNNCVAIKDLNNINIDFIK